MLRKEMKRAEIENELKGKGDFVLIDNMTRFLKENLSNDIKRFVYSKLVGIYEKRNMFSVAANGYQNLAKLSLSPSDKINYLIKETECYIKAGFYDNADIALKNAMGEVKASEKLKIMLSIKEFYKNQAQNYEKEKRRQKALKTYEKLLTMNLLDTEKNEINKKLLELYKELGMITEYMNMEKKLG